MSTRTTAAQAAHRTTLDAIRFAEVDVNGDGRLDFDEFLALQPSALRKEHTVAEFRSWFAAVDTDSSGTISLTEWFLWVLGKEAARTAHRPTASSFRASSSRPLDARRSASSRLASAPSSCAASVRNSASASSNLPARIFVRKNAN
jgi:hypothetical protein